MLEANESARFYQIFHRGGRSLGKHTVQIQLRADSERYHKTLSDADLLTGRKYFNIDISAIDEVSSSMAGSEIEGVCRETAVQVMPPLMHSHSKTAGSLMHSLMEEFESLLRNKTPFLLNAQVLEEYTRFENEHK